MSLQVLQIFERINEISLEIGAKIKKSEIVVQTVFKDPVILFMKQIIGQHFGRVSCNWKELVCGMKWINYYELPTAISWRMKHDIG